MSAYTQLFKSKDAHPLLIDVALLDIFGAEWIGWDSDDTNASIERKLEQPPSRESRCKVNALSVIHSNLSYWEDWRAFEILSWSLYGKQVDLIETNPLTVAPLLYGYRTVRWVEGDTKQVFSDEVAAYVASVFINDQFSLLPPDVYALQERVFSAVSDARDRAAAVRAALADSAVGAPFDDVVEDPIKVEVQRHRVLASSLRASCSQEALINQAIKYGMQPMLEQVLKGGKS